MSSPEDFAETVNLLWKSLDYVEKGDADVSDIQSWLDLNMEAIRTLRAFMAAELCRSKKKKCETSMTHLLTIQCRLRNLLKTGGRLQDPTLPALDAEQEAGRNQEKPLNERVQWDDMLSAFVRRIRSGVITNLAHLDIVSFMNDAQTLFESKIATALNEYNALKVNTELSAEYIIQKSEGVIAEVKYFNTENASIYQTTDIKQWFDEHVRQPILLQIEEFEQKDSGWTLREILSLAVNINKFNPLSGSSYIALPIEISKKKACVNVQNDDDQCFKWAVLSALYPQEHNAHRVSLYYRFAKNLNFDGIEFPVMPKQISKFEKQNDISINLYILKKSGQTYKVHPCHVTSLKKERHVNLLFLEDHYIDEDEEENKDDDDNARVQPRFHYVWIKNLSRLVRKQLTDNKKQHYICDRCLHFFNKEERLRNHEIDCAVLNKSRIQLPSKENNLLFFNGYHRQIKVPYVIHADFECLLKPVEDDTRAFQQHQAYSIGYYLKCSFDDERSTYKSYRQLEEGTLTPAEWFIQELKGLVDELKILYENPIPMELTVEEIEGFIAAQECHICKKVFSENDKKVRDHCHLTGRYRGAAHEACNINFKDARFIPIIFHNLTGYDSHFIIKELATASTLEGRVKLIAENKERYISFTKYVKNSDINFRFLDSFRFMPSSLEKLASYLDKLDITSSVFQKSGYSTNQIELLLRKGIFPYDYVSSFDKLKDEQLPSKDDFFSKLTESDIAQADYDHAKCVWETFGITTLGEYSDLYLKTDVLLLTDIFENFRSTCIAAYGLDPAHYFTTPGLTWDAMLKYTKVQLELLTHIDMLMFIEKGIRGGVSQCSNRYAKANNKFMGEDYNPNEEEKYLMYYDANNLYGWAMTEYLPTNDLKWAHNFNEKNLLNIPDDSDIGFILEVDLDYPVALHDSHKDLPLCPDHEVPCGGKQKKLLTTLHDKKRYVIHYRALKQAIKHGLILKKVHRVLQFRQSAWLKSYVDLNTEKRKGARNEFEKLFFKLMINAVYGKTMENERKRVDVKLVNKWTGRYGAEALIAKSNFHSRSIFDENLVAVQLARTSIAIRKPIYIGLCVLDISKTLIYDFHYSYMKRQIGDRCKLLYTDTDSLIYEIQGVNIYEIMKKDIDKFDTSDYPVENQFGLPCKNKKAIGLMKDECSGNIMMEFIGLRSKMYAIRIQNVKPIKKAKGIKAAVLKTRIDFENYRTCLFNNFTVKCYQNNIRSKCHIIQTERQEKIALSPHDDKRVLLSNSTDTLPWGHYSIMPDEDDEVILRAAMLFEEEGETISDVVGAAEEREGVHKAVGAATERGEGLHKERSPSTEHIRSVDEQEDGQPPNKKLRV